MEERGHKWALKVENRRKKQQWAGPPREAVEEAIDSHMWHSWHQPLTAVQLTSGLFVRVCVCVSLRASS